MTSSKILFYCSCLVLGIYTQLSWEIFGLAMLPCLFFVLFLFVLSQEGVSYFYSTPFLLLTIGAIIFLAPSNYIFTFLMAFSLLCFCLTYITKTMLPQLIVSISFLLFLFIKPGYVLVFIMHYQRFMSSLVG